MKFRTWFNENMRDLAKAYSDSLRNVPQNPIYHPEGNVLNHVKLVRKAIPKAVQELQNLQQTHPVIGPALSDLDFNLDATEQSIVALAAWSHDLGKITATETLPNGKIQSLRHQEPHHYEPQLEKLKELAPQKTIDLFMQNESLIRFLIEHHMDLIQNLPKNFMAKYFVNGKFTNVPEVKLLLVLCWADKMGRTPESIEQILSKTVTNLTNSIQNAIKRTQKSQKPIDFDNVEDFAKHISQKPLTRAQKIAAIHGKFPELDQNELEKLVSEYAFYGSISDPLDNKIVGNADMPEIQSKTQTKDGMSSAGQDLNPKIDPDKAYGYNKKPDDKSNTIERQAKRIDRKSGIPLRMDRPDIPR